MKVMARESFTSEGQMEGLAMTVKEDAMAVEGLAMTGKKKFAMDSDTVILRNE